MEPSLPLALAALFAVGLLAGLLNVVAGGGSLLTLPVLIFLGLPPSVANGTNRVAILWQNVFASWSFRRYGLLDRELVLQALAPALAGSVLGTVGALWIGERAFQRVLAWVMVAVVSWTLFGLPRLRARSRRADPAGAAPAEGAGAASDRRSRASGMALTAGFFVVGAYGGFVQAGVGFLILAVLQLSGLDLVRGNAVKVATILGFTALSLAIFAWQGKVLWGHGMALAAGNSLGGLAGVRLTVAKGERWIQRVLVITVLAFAVRLWMSS